MDVSSDLRSEQPSFHDISQSDSSVESSREEGIAIPVGEVDAYTPPAPAYPKQRILFGHTDDVSCFAYSPDGSFLVSGQVIE